MCLTFSLTSCSDDDNNDGEATPSQLVGKWVIVKEEGYVLIENKKIPTDETYKVSDESDVCEFKKDGTFRNYGYYITSSGEKKLDYDETAQWILNGTTITVTEKDGESGTVKIKELTDSKLVLIFEEEDMDEYYYSENTYQKVK